MHGLDLTLLAQILAFFTPLSTDVLALLKQLPWGAQVLFLLWLLWVFYLAVMNLKRVKDAGKLGRVAFVLGVPVLIVGLVLDVLANLVVFTVLLAELPRWGEWTVTARLQRHHGTTGWRAKVAQWFESELLGAPDPKGYHVADGNKEA